MAIAAAVIAGVFVPGQSALAAPDAPVVEVPPAERGVDGLEAPDSASAQTIARLVGERVEVIGERTGNSSTWALPDGTFSVGVAAGPIWVRQPTGDGTVSQDWAPVDLTLAVTPEGAVAPVSFPGELTLAGGGAAPASGQLVALAGGG
ncbi:hypothetical protein [Modestobacter sp. Leaf380]|uniref:hypothetical protein n=1 Tax=Modestobacter sp. Leaf380 TaxID=1736356 RepID=UPI0006FFD2B3|nr:hypothetical protein [Modestobacter sp. Leaf380]KQS65761.1 hypothetical protein ASG41_14315 [Modestobacter sp. Leaf380]